MIPFRDRNPSGTFPYVTIALIAINVLVFIHELGQDGRQLQSFVDAHGLRPAFVSGLARGNPSLAHYAAPILLPLLTSMFLHAGWLHLIGNMWYLWIFGGNVEDRLGHFRYAAFYVLCGLGASVVHVAFNPDSRVPTVGASGAIAGVLGAYLVAFPRAQVDTLIPLPFFLPLVISLPAIVVLGFWFALQLVSGLDAVTMVQTGGVAWWAHIGGFVFGALLLFVFQKPPERRRVYAYRR